MLIWFKTCHESWTFLCPGFLPHLASGQKGLPGAQGWCGWKRSLCFTLHFPDHLWGWTSFLYVYRRFRFSVLWIPFVPFIFHSIVLFFLFSLNYRSLYIFWMLTFFDFTYQYLFQLCDLYFYFLCSDFSFLVIFSCNIVRFTIFLVICIFLWNSLPRNPKDILPYFLWNISNKKIKFFYLGFI